MDRLLPSDPPRIGGYRLLRRLGAGGMGVVYAGRSAGGDLAAVKVIQPQWADEPGFRARFRREVEAARRVSDPWVVPLLDADVEARAPWLATGYVPGPSLAEAVAACGPMPPRAVRLLGKALARALCAVHAAGLVHRDVKPGNVLLALDGPRLIDFGIARFASPTAVTGAAGERTDDGEPTGTGVVVGTPGFLAPEQARAAETGRPGDVFSLGCVLAYCVTGRLPFGTGAVEAQLYRTVHDAPDLEGIVDGELAALLERCLAKDPAARPTAAEVDASLAEDAPDGATHWLPDPVVRLVAGHSAEALALLDAEATVVDPSRGQRAAPARRRVLAWAAGATVLAAGGGAALWATIGPDDTGAGNAAAGRPRRVLGLQADLTGPGKDEGKAQERGALLAVKEFNARGERPFTAVLEVADDRGEEARAVTVARRLTGRLDILAVLGPTSDRTALAVQGVYDEAGLPLLSVSTGLAVSYNLTQPQYHFRVAPTSRATVIGEGKVLKERGVRRLGMLWDRSGTTGASETALLGQRVFAENGLDVHPRIVPRGTTSFGDVVAEILARGVDSFFFAGAPAGAVAVVRELSERGFDGLRLLGHAAVDAAFLREAGAAAEGWLTVTPYLAPTAGPLKDFTAAHQDLHGRTPDVWAAEAYDATRMVLARLTTLERRQPPASPSAPASSAAASAPPTRPTRAQVGDALARGTYKGVVRTYAFQDDRTLHADDGQPYLHEITGGRLRHVSG
ncbi:bifunctional serine/threonine-protein kinase/ABC transporter substrate-binding protein [Streptomyces sp. WMMC940]|uniref:bifunctional serine/threonine-protein kinase/ABC transporter substrate-binding protein n=1 Tax=Streptomyces sp. WMMC940 TaxID=3015153 RepID=UPI0022B67B1C|nr:bifunctional serine/threonine-protein kinase/ABC transporter substrate-binding protein [Streptomyces sp. WMMC940]MCZ7462265.1 bifunctional serine/threonine-protein kinase/ABC transporter substrate-binding protein [Streptomyces sp. WMMC940]